jgi:hypothetical protein
LFPWWCSKRISKASSGWMLAERRRRLKICQSRTKDLMVTYADRPPSLIFGDECGNGKSILCDHWYQRQQQHRCQRDHLGAPTQPTKYTCDRTDTSRYRWRFRFSRFSRLVLFRCSWLPEAVDRLQYCRSCLVGHHRFAPVVESLAIRRETPICARVRGPCTTVHSNTRADE